MHRANRHVAATRQELARAFTHRRHPSETLREEKEQIIREEAAQGYHLAHDYLREADGVITLTFKAEDGTVRERFLVLPAGSRLR